MASLVVCILGLLLMVSPSLAATSSDIVRSIQDINTRDRIALERSLGREFGLGFQFKDNTKAPMADFLARSVFNGEPPAKASQLSKMVYKGLTTNVPRNQLLELAEMGFSETLTENRLFGGARALAAAENARLPAEVYYDLIRHGMTEGWTGPMLEASVQGLRTAKSRGLDLRKTAIAIVIRFDAGLSGLTPTQAVQQEIAGLRNLRDYNAVHEAIQAGVPADIANEIYQIAREESWTSAQLTGVLEGLQQAVARGLTVEKAALAMIVRIEQGLDVSVKKMVAQELDYVARMDEEQRRLSAIRKDVAAQKRIRRPPPVPVPAIVNLNRDLLRNSILSFYNAPTRYQWGGTSRGQRGTDCSGFVMSCYREQGITVPRVSRDQYKWLDGKSRLVPKKKLSFGDLVFFNANGSGRITHVGMYYENDKFVHSCSSKGVTFTPLYARYYVKRYVGGGRVAD